MRRDSGRFRAVGIGADEFDLEGAVGDPEAVAQHLLGGPLDLLEAVGVFPLDHHMRLEIGGLLVEMPDVQIVRLEIGSESARGRVCTYGSVSEVGVSI